MGIREEGFFTYFAHCPDCWNKSQEEARKLVLEKGRVPCLNPDHNTHRLYSEQCSKCRRKGYVPFSDDKWRDLMDEYREMRELVCPECGRKKEEMSEAMVEGYTPDGSVNKTEGLRCPCGWEGFGDELSLRKK